MLAAVRLGGGSVGWGSDWSRKGLGQVLEGAWCGGPEWIIVSSIGYDVLSGKMQVDRQETSFCTCATRRASVSEASRKLGRCTLPSQLHLVLFGPVHYVVVDGHVLLPKLHLRRAQERAERSG